jgi:hypothetical protein
MNMTDSKVLNRIIQAGVEDDVWNDEVVFEDLRIAINQDGDRVFVSEGRSERWADYRAINFVILGLWDPRWTFEQLREEAPNNADDIIDDHAMGRVNATQPQVREDQYDVCRTRGMAKSLCEIGAFLANDDRQDNYTYRVFRVMADSERKLGIGTNPLGAGIKEFYGRGGPVRLMLAEDEDEGGDGSNADSAADANW